MSPLVENSRPAMPMIPNAPALEVISVSVSAIWRRPPLSRSGTFSSTRSVTSRRAASSPATTPNAATRRMVSGKIAKGA